MSQYDSAPFEKYIPCYSVHQSIYVVLFLIKAFRFKFTNTFKFTNNNTFPTSLYRREKRCLWKLNYRKYTYFGT